ncbi:kinase-like domain-containing protein [Mycena leptocephala]|nr:kinase-like domain-containing protein [Mycena leptocephala]
MSTVYEQRDQIVGWAARQEYPLSTIREWVFLVAIDTGSSDLWISPPSDFVEAALERQKKLAAAVSLTGAKPSYEYVVVLRSLAKPKRNSTSRTELAMDGTEVALICLNDWFPFAGGANSNVYRGNLVLSDGSRIRVAIKMIRYSEEDSGQVDRRLRREVEIWRTLKHKNVLPFIGLCDDLAPWPALLSPLCGFGHVANYIKNHPHASRNDLAYGVACGLHYLDEKNVIHGDLKVQNVVVNHRGVPCICDFGFSKIVNRPGCTTRGVGTVPYLAPELLFVFGDKSVNECAQRTTQSSDIYAFALLVLEVQAAYPSLLSELNQDCQILIAEPPKGRPSKVFVELHVFEAHRPQREDYGTELVTEMWDVLERCWDFNHHARPNIGEILTSPAFLTLSAEGSAIPELKKYQDEYQSA